jgi:hypothetical protein
MGTTAGNRLLPVVEKTRYSAGTDLLKKSTTPLGPLAVFTSFKVVLNLGVLLRARYKSSLGAECVRGTTADPALSGSVGSLDRMRRAKAKESLRVSETKESIVVMVWTGQGVACLGG